MLNSILILTSHTIPKTVTWSPSVGLLMILCNLLAIAIGYYAIQNPGKGPAIPIPQLASRKSFGLPELLATTSLGHILGAGLILGLSNAGLL
jgi:photosystem I subunit 10